MTKVLVVENDPEVRDVIADTMEVEHAAMVTHAITGARGAEAIDQEAFDLAIIDVFVPDISGFELAAHAAKRNIPTLFCTGHPDVLAQLQRHDCAYLAKPFALADLITESAKVIANTAENIRRVEASVAKLHATTVGLRAALAESRRLLDESKILCADLARPR